MSKEQNMKLASSAYRHIHVHLQPPQCMLRKYSLSVHQGHISNWWRCHHHSRKALSNLPPVDSMAGAENQGEARTVQSYSELESTRHRGWPALENIQKPWVTLLQKIPVPMSSKVRWIQGCFSSSELRDSEVFWCKSFPFRSFSQRTIEHADTSKNPFEDTVRPCSWSQPFPPPFSPALSYSLLFSVCIRSWVFWMFTKLCSLLERSSCKDEVKRPWGRPLP